MKIRIKGDSVRFRLTKTEVKQLCEQGAVKDVTHFGPSRFAYAVYMVTDSNCLQAEFKNDTITLFLPKALGEDWFTSERVGFEDVQDGLYLLLEKDFTCLDNRLEDQSDNYPNPKLMDNM